MSTDEQLRSRLVASTDHLVPDLELELARTLRRAQKRRHLRMVGVAAAAATVVGVAWVTGVPGVERADRSVDPVGTPDTTTTGVTDMAGLYGRLAPGTYSIPAFGHNRGDHLPRAIADIPEGYFTNGGWVVDAGGVTLETQQWGDLGIWPVERVVTDVCDSTHTARVGPSVRDLADALAAQRGSTTTPPRPVSLGGHRGLYLELTTDPDIDPLTCTGAELALWRATPEQVHGHNRAGIVSHLWIVDVDGTRLVVGVSNYPGEPRAQHQELIDIAETIRFAEPIGP